MKMFRWLFSDMEKKMRGQIHRELDDVYSTQSQFKVDTVIEKYEHILSLKNKERIEAVDFLTSQYKIEKTIAKNAITYILDNINKTTEVVEKINPAITELIDIGYLDDEGE